MNRVAWTRPGGGWWLGAAGAAFTAAELLFVSPRMGLSWDEVVYVSQVSGHAPAAWFDPARARGVPLLVAPVAALTGSVTALRVYLSVVGGLGLALALRAWRGLRPAWLLALAGVVFGGLWVTQYYGAQAMPDFWSALGSLAAVGCYLRWVRDGGRGTLAGLGVSMALVTLIRPGDAAYLAVPLLAASLLPWPGRTGPGRAGWWQRWPAVAATGLGLLAGGAEWVAEAYLRFGGLASRLRAAGAEQGGFGLHFALLDELKALNGPTLCRPCTVGVRYPELDLWWFLLPVLVALAVLAARQAVRGTPAPGAPGPVTLETVLLPVACACCVAAQYLFMINYAAPRFLLPAYALLAVPAADGLAFLRNVPGSALRPAMTAVLGGLLAVQLVGQHLVLDHEVGGTVVFHDDYSRIATVLAERGVRPPCLVRGVQDIPVAFYAGCASAPGPAAPGEAVAVLVRSGGRPPSGVARWPVYRITGTRILKVNVYVRRP